MKTKKTAVCYLMGLIIKHRQLSLFKIAQFIRHIMPIIIVIRCIVYTIPLIPKSELNCVSVTTHDIEKFKTTASENYTDEWAIGIRWLKSTTHNNNEKKTSYAIRTVSSARKRNRNRQRTQKTHLSIHNRTIADPTHAINFDPK